MNIFAKTMTIAAAGILSTATLSYAAGMMTDDKGRALYTYDGDKDGTPTCYEDCAKMWTPYVASEGQEMGEGWTTVKRTDGTMQMVYNGRPVYYYMKDKEGEVNGKADGWHSMEKK